jgi:PH/SEC7 domain-containing protein
VSKEPLVEAVSSTEYGWNRPVEILRAKKAANPSYRPQITSGSFDVIYVEGQKIQVKEWKPPVSSAVHSSLDEEQQLESLKRYIETVEDSLTKHSAYLADMLQVFPSGHLVSTRAHSNWERRSQYFLKETVKYEVYVSTLERALKDKQETHLFDE